MIILTLRNHGNLSAGYLKPPTMSLILSQVLVSKQRRTSSPYTLVRLAKPNSAGRELEVINNIGPLMAIREVPADYDLSRWIETTTELTRRNDILRSTYIHTPEFGCLQISLRNPTLRLERVVLEDATEEDNVVEAFWEEKFVF